MKGSLSMRKFKEILRLNKAGLSQRQIAHSLSISLGVVHKYLTLARLASLSWPLQEGLDDQELKKLLFQRKRSGHQKHYTPPDCEWVYKELKHKGVTLRLLHEEYKSLYPETFYQYTKFCDIYQRWKKQQALSCRQTYQAGDCLCVDYTGPTVPITDKHTGRLHKASIFVAVLAASHYTYAEATLDQTLGNWIGSHCRAFTFFGGVASLIIPDNLKSGVSQAHRYDPDINPAYSDMAAYYNTAIMPARPYKPKDKARVEGAVQGVERWILAKLRHHTFYSLSELNEAIKKLLKELNEKPFQKREGSRYSHFKAYEEKALKPLPASPYDYALFKRLKVTPDYHIPYEQHYYSVPYTYVGEKVELRITAHTLEVLAKGQRIASHTRSFYPGKTTLPEHQPPHHRKHCEWTPESCFKWAADLGHATEQVMKKISQKGGHPQQLYRFFLGFLKLRRYFGPHRLEAACQRALFYEQVSYKKIHAILEKGLDKEPLPFKPDDPLPIEHENIRGPRYYKNHQQL